MQCSAAGAVRNLCCNQEDGTKQTVAELDGLEMLIAAATNHVADEGVLSQVSGALRNLSLNDAVAARIAAGGGIGALVRASAAHRGSAKV